MGPRPQPSLVDGEYVMTAEDFRRITALLHADSGIVMNDTKATLVYSRLAKRLRTLGLENFRSYCDLVAGVDGLDERQQMLSALTTNLTRFFREPHHFEDLRTKLGPGFVRTLRAGGRVRIWSAGCSNGAEPYSIALSLLSIMPDAADHDVKILASDIDFRMIEACRRGVYAGEQAEAVPAPLRERWMRPVTHAGQPAWEVGEEMRELVAFRELNLIGPWPMKGRFDAIFCRNVVIYFSEETQNVIWRRFVDLLAPGGRLYIGHSERLGGDASRLLRPDGFTTYRLASSQAAS